MWAVYAALSAVFAAATSILAKCGMDGINSNLATALRTGVVLIMAWMMVFITGAQRGLREITLRGAVFLVLSGIATGLSWLCYFRALQLGEVSKVVPIDKMSVVLTLVFAALFLGEKWNFKSVVGALLITAGTLVMAL